MSRLFWTCVVPVVPAAVLFDGIVSCLRIYSPDEVTAMAREVGDEAFAWEAALKTRPDRRFRFRI